MNNDYNGLEVAVIGMSCQFPMSKNIHEFWSNLIKKKECISFFDDKELKEGLRDPSILNNPLFIKAKGYIEDAECFDSSFFGYSDEEAEIMDPQIRLLHENTWKALEDAGYIPGENTDNIGVYITAFNNLLWRINTSLNNSKAIEFGLHSFYSNKEFAALLLSYNLNLKGPSITLSASCSSSLISVHMAVRALIGGECDIAIAGGVNISLPNKGGYLYKEGQIFSQDGHCKPFDDNASGTVFGDGLGVVVLKPLKEALQDRDNIYCIIKGTSVNNDGRSKVGFAAPGTKRQTKVIKDALEFSEVDPSTIDFIETHGTGTLVGDPIEIKALMDIYKNVNAKIHIGSVKGNIGHLNISSGIAGFIKSALVIKNKILPPTINFSKLNSKIDFDGLPFVINTNQLSLENKKTPIRGGVSAFGLGGINSHAILEELPVINNNNKSRRYQIINLSAKSKYSLEKITENYLNFLQSEKNINLYDLAFTLKVGRQDFQERILICINSVEELCQKIKNHNYVDNTVKKKKDVVFMFPGQGMQHINMGLDLYNHEPFFKDILDDCFSKYKKIKGENFKEIIFSEESVDENHLLISETRITQPALFIIEYALAKLLIHWGIQPDAMIGHSIGEYVAACISGVFSLEDALKLVIARGELMQTVEKGAMLGVYASYKNLVPVLEDCQVDIAAVNSNEFCVISGSFEHIQKTKSIIEAKRIVTIELRTSHAFHSRMMNSILNEFEDILNQIIIGKPEIPYISNLTGTWISQEQLNDSRYWSKHLRNAVCFAQGIDAIDNRFDPIFVELGPGKSLSGYVKQSSKNSDCIITNVMRHQKEKTDDDLRLAEALGFLWLHGVPINWSKYYENEIRCRISLPTYYFNKKTYSKYFDFKNISSKKSLNFNEAPKRNEINEWYYTQNWTQTSGTSIDTTINSDKAMWLVFADNHDVCDQIIPRLNGKVHKIKAGEKFQTFEEFISINIINPSDYENLFKILDINEYSKLNIIHALSLTGKDNLNLDYGFNSVILLAKALIKKKVQVPTKLFVFSEGIFPVIGFEKLHPVNSLLNGPIKVISQEHPFIQTKLFDLYFSENRKEVHFESDQIIEELISSNRENVVAFRFRKRYIQKFEHVNLSKAKEDFNVFDPNGVYLITGGLGEIGYELSSYFIEKYQLNLVLLGKTELDASKNKNFGSKLNKLQNLYELGGKVTYYACDIGNFIELSEIVENIEKSIGDIKGVIHCAGIVSKSSILMKNIEIEDCAIQFKPKVQGIINIDKVFCKKKLDFCVCVSSLSTILGGLGYLAYSSANSFLDAFVFNKNQEGNNWYCINWDEWNFNKENSKLKSVSLIRKEGIKPIEGIQTFITILENKLLKQVIVSTSELNERVNSWIKNSNNELKDEDYGDTEIEHKSNLANIDIEENLLSLWKEFFNNDNLSENDDFFALGGDSLKAISLIAAINKRLNVNITLLEFMGLLTVKKLHEFIYLQKIGDHYIGIKKSEKKEYYKLSDAQSRIYFLQQLQTNTTVYNIKSIFKFSNFIVDVSRFESCINKLLERHEILRTSIEMIHNRPVQKICRKINFKLIYEKVGEQVINLKELENRINLPFDLKFAPFFNIGLFHHFKDSYIILVQNHIITDGRSSRLFTKELIKLYFDESLPEQQLQYKDYSEWQNSTYFKKKIKPLEDYWLSQFKEPYTNLNLPYDFPRPQLQSFNGEEISFTINSFTQSRIERFIKDQNVTLFDYLFSTYNILLFKLSQQTDIIIGVPVVGRRQEELENILGFFINVLPIRTKINETKSFIDFCSEIKNNNTKSIDNQEYPFERLVEKIVKNRDLSRNPIFDVAFLMQNFEDKDDDNISLIKTENTSSKFDITFEIKKDKGKLTINVEFCTKLFNRGSIEYFLLYYQELLNKTLDNPNILINEIDILTEDLKGKIINDFNATHKEYSLCKTIDILLDEMSIAHPHKVALVYKNEHITYNQLVKKSQVVANNLIKANKNQKIIGIYINRSIEMMISLFGIIKTGAAFLPIDTNFPYERIKYIIEDSGTNLILTDKKESDFLNCECLNINSLIQNLTKDLPLSHIEPSDLAYLIYTSGSTGKPKGISIEHKSLLNFIMGMSQVVDFDQNKIILALTTISFDIFILETILPLTKGMKVIIGSSEDQMQHSNIPKLIESRSINMIQLTPTRLSLILRSHPDHIWLNRLQDIMVGGEAFPSDLLEKLKKVYFNNLFNFYGPTETTVWSTVKNLTGSSDINIGRPIANTTIYILDNNKKPLPINCVGNLYIGGDGLARGYWGKPELTNEKFIENPLKRGEKIYKTGDLGRWLSNGEVQFIGRDDEQVKLNGYRIELCEIENVLKKNEHIINAAVAISKDKAGDAILCAYIILRKEITSLQLKEYLLKELPAYMVPNRFYKLKEFPLTQNQKIDKKSLVNVGELIEAGNNEYVKPQTELEKQLQSICSNIFELNLISVESNFFEIGGNSAKIIVLNQRINELLGLEEEVVTLFRYPSIKSYAKYLSNRKNDDVLKNEQIIEDRQKQNIRKVMLDKKKNLRNN